MPARSVKDDTISLNTIDHSVLVIEPA